MTAQDQVRIILRNIEALGKPYPDFVMVGTPKLWPPNSWSVPAPEPPDDGRVLWSRIGCGVSCFFAAAAVAFPFLVKL